MELTHMLEQHIETRNTRLVNSTIHEILNVQNKKWMLVDFLINLYCRDYITRNIWILQEFDRIFEQIESNRQNIPYIVNIASLLCQLDKKPINLWSENTDVNLQLLLNDCQSIPNLFQSPQIKETNPQAWELLNIIYYNLLDNDSIHSTRDKRINYIFTIIRYFLNNNHKIFKTSGNNLGVIPLDCIDHLFLIIKYYIDNNNVDSEILDYIILSKNLFFYKIKKKYKKHRINILFYCFYIIVSQKIKSFTIQYDDFSVSENSKQSHDLQNTSIDLSNTNYDYMFVMLDIDPESIEIATQAKSLKKSNDFNHKKNIDMDTSHKNFFISSIDKHDHTIIE